jgi:hypothetical protein
MRPKIKAEITLKDQNGEGDAIALIYAYDDGSIGRMGLVEDCDKLLEFLKIPHVKNSQGGIGQLHLA